MTEQRNETITRLLALDTSTSALTTAYLENGRLVDQTSSRAERNHSIYLVPTIRQLLRANGTSPAGLDGIAVGLGPGSYTGVRIGVSVAKTMAWALGIPVIGVSGLEAMARGGRHRAGRDAEEAESACWYVPLLDARRGQVYTGLYADEAGRWRAAVADGIRLMRDWADELLRAAEAGAPPDGLEQPLRKPNRIVFLGETAGFEAAVETVAQRWSGRVETMPLDMEAAWIGEIALERWALGERDDIHRLVPNYTQLAEAEVKLLQKEKQGGEPFGGTC